MTSALSAGITSAMTSSIPTSAATVRAVVALSPVSRTVRRPSALSLLIASAEVGLIASATTNTRGGASVPAGDDRGLAACLGRLPCGIEFGGEMHGPVGEEGGPAGDDGVPVDDALVRRGPRDS